MSAAPLPPPAGDGTEALALRGRAAPIVLHERGFFHPRSTAFGGTCFTRYEDVTHLVSGRRALRLGTRSGVFLLHRAAFQDPDGPERLARAVISRIEASPGGAEQLARMARLDLRWLRARRPRVSFGVSLLCVAAYALQLLHRPEIDLAAVFSASLVEMGELWRVVTANFLHGFVLHLIMNVLCVLVVGALVENSIGSAAAALVMGVSGLGAMGASWWAGYEQALGASGIVFGLIGSVLWLEFRHPGEVPAPWRFPRRVLLAALIGENLVMLSVPGIAHAAHGGGLVAGALATALVAGPSLAGARPRWVLAGDAVLAALLLGSGAAAGWAAFGGAETLLARRADRLLEREDLSPAVLNDQAWLIATSDSPSPAQLDVARRLAERAVQATGRLEPNLLDTLAEVHFAAGRLEEAVATIDEAIALAPGESYFREQRRRYTGERAAQDRPAPPGPWPDLPPGLGPGLRPRPDPVPPDGGGPRDPHLPEREPPGLRV